MNFMGSKGHSGQDSKKNRVSWDKKGVKGREKEIVISSFIKLRQGIHCLYRCILEKNRQNEKISYLSYPSSIYWWCRMGY